MLFASVGQGAIFLMLLCVGCVVAIAEFALVVVFRRIKNYLVASKQKSTKIDKNSQKNNQKIQKNTEKYTKLQESTKIEENQQKIIENNKKSQKFIEKDKNKQKFIKIHKKSQKRTKFHKNKQKNTTANAVVEEGTKTNLSSNVGQFLLGFARVAVYATAICVFVWRYDFGSLRAYHILAFLVGFGAIKTIFAYRHNLVPQNDKI